MCWHTLLGGRVTLKLCARDASTALVDKVLITGGAGMKPRRPPKYYLRKYTAKALKFSVHPAPGRFVGAGG